MTGTRIESLDLLRGIAIGLVMLRHGVPGLFPGAGVVGVVMFFTLSGYLISGVLLAELDRTGSLRLRDFYVRRLRRLAPALLVMLCGLTLVTVVVDPLGDRDRLGATWLVALTWTANLPGRPDISEAAFHLWTLAGEEQFYLVLPALLLLGHRRGRTGAAIAVAALGAAAGCAATLWWLWEVPDNAYVLPTSWAGCFVIGVAARWLQERIPRPGPPAIAISLVVLAALSLVEVRGHAWTYVLVGPVVATSTAALVLAWRRWHRVEPLPLRWLVLLGSVSYGAYLWNYPLTLWLRPFGGWGSVLAAVLTLALAGASWRWVERPVLSTRRASPTPREKVPSC